MSKKIKKDENNDIKKFRAFVTKVLGKADAKLFFQNSSIWEDRIEKNEPELDRFVLNAIEFDNAACAVILMDDWIKHMNNPQNYEVWCQRRSDEKKKIIDDYYFKLKTIFFRNNLRKFGGRKGIADVILKSGSELEKKNYDFATKLAKSLLDVFDYNPFVSNDSFKYVSISNEMEWIVYCRFYEMLNSQVRNINFICPIEYILFKNTVIAFEKKEYPLAEKYLIELLKWNPVSVYGLWYLSLVYLNMGLWENCLLSIIRGLKNAYTSNHLRLFYGVLMSYFECKNLKKDILCCNYLKLQYASSDEQRAHTIRDFQYFSKSSNYIKKLCDDYIHYSLYYDSKQKKNNEKLNKRINVTIEDIRESSRKYGYPIGINSNIVEIARKAYQKTVHEGDERKEKYLSSILVEMEKCVEKEKNIQLTMSSKIEKFSKNKVN